MEDLKKATFKYIHQDNDVVFDLKEAQNVLKDTLKDFQSFCEKYGIEFSLSYGSLLGAARNGDIIPWDNDVDLMTTRTDFERLIGFMPKLSEFGLKAYHYTTIRHTYTNEVRIYRDGYYRIIESNGRKYLSPLCIDVFPFDKINRNTQKEAKILNKIKKDKEILLLKELKRNSRNMFYGMMRNLKKTLYIFLPSKRLHKRIEKNIAKLYSGGDDYYLFSSYASEHFSLFFEKDLFDKLIKIKFGSLETHSIESYKDFLTTIYGEWSKPCDRSGGKVFISKFLKRIDDK